MIYLHIHGRLGNQLFQYAHARYLQYITGDELVIDYRDVFLDHADLSEESLARYNVIPYRKANGTEIPKTICYLIRIAWHLKPINHLRTQYYIERLICPILALFGICYYDSNCHIMHYRPKKGKFNYIKGWYESPKYFSKIDDIIRKEINGLRKDDAVEQVLNLFARTKDNKEFISKIARIRSAHSR